MVTTNSSIKEARGLFKQASEAATKLVANTDEIEQEVVARAHELVRLAVKAVVPVLKYVDSSMPIGDVFYRAVTLDVHMWGEGRGTNTLYLTRDGFIGYAHASLVAPDRFLMQGSFDRKGHEAEDITFYALDILKGLRQVFRNALAKIDERREGLTRRVSQLEAAAAAFQKGN